MIWPVYHIASGQSFFSGILLVLVSVFLTASEGRMARSLAFVFFVLGTVAVYVSSAGLPFPLYAVAGAAILFWLIAVLSGRWRFPAGVFLVLVGVSAVATELPYHSGGSLKGAGSARSFAVIGDSITAGIGRLEASRRWPRLLDERHQLEIQDLSRAGATVGSALKRVEERSRIDSPVVILEIGGNDLIRLTPPDVFERRLELLILKVMAPGRQLIMFELPLPPFRHSYSRTQRTLARKYGITLIPKRFFLDILAEESATVDSIHLS
ncbi:MAG: GDSL-type esterase/lipase family protein, partial [Verrucomicrobiota bacterium]